MFGFFEKMLAKFTVASFLVSLAFATNNKVQSSVTGHNNATIHLSHVSPTVVSVEGGELLRLYATEVIPLIEKAVAICWISTVENHLPINVTGYGYSPTSIQPGIIQLPAKISGDRCACYRYALIRSKRFKKFCDRLFFFFFLVLSFRKSLECMWPDGSVMGSGPVASGVYNRPCAGVLNDTKCRVLGEGPYALTVSYGNSRGLSVSDSNAVAVRAYKKLSASPGRTPYYGQSAAGEILVRASHEIVRTSGEEELLVRASTTDGHILIEDEIIPVGLKLAIPINMSQLNPNGRSQVQVSLMVRNRGLGNESTREISSVQIQLTRVEQDKIGAVGIDHNTRAILVDGEQFLPISWTSTTNDAFGPEVDYYSPHPNSMHPFSSDP